MRRKSGSRQRNSLSLDEALCDPRSQNRDPAEKPLFGPFWRTMLKVNGTGPICREFIRAAPTALGERTELPLGWCAIYWRFIDGIDGMAERRKQHGRVWRISCDNRSIFRILRFSGNLQYAAGSPAQIAVDYLGWLVLCDHEENLEASRKLSLRPAAWYECPLFAFKHPDLTYQLATWIAVISLFLGLISIGLAVIPFLK